MPKTTVYHDVKGLNRALRKVPKVANVELRDASQVIAADIASKAAHRARSVGGVAKYVAPTIRARRDRIPVVVMGGSRRLPAATRSRAGSRQTVGDVWAGAEFGSRRYTQFPPVTRPGRFLWATVDEESDTIMDCYSDALGDALRKVK